MKETIKNEILKRYKILSRQGLITGAKDRVRDGKVLISSTLQKMGIYLSLRYPV